MLYSQASFWENYYGIPLVFSVLCGMKDAEPELISNMCLLLYPILLGFYGVYLYKYDAEKQQIKA